MDNFQNTRSNVIRSAREGLSPESLDLLRPHVVNLAGGRLSEHGVLSTTQADLAAIFDDHLPRSLKLAREKGRELPIVFYAHGGLVSEQNALSQALEDIPWWKKNNVYPIYFIWETSFWETVLALIGIPRELQARGADRAFISDPLIEMVARAAGGPFFWAGMKDMARSASSKSGGAFDVAQRLAEFCSKDPDGIRLHAVGHSAGAIFHNHFLPAAIESLKSHKLPLLGFRTLHLLAPALTVQDFQESLALQMGKEGGIDMTTIFALRKEWEWRDQSGPYGKSLLYLIYNALEAAPQTPLLGLWESLYADPKIQGRFGLRGKSSDHGALVLSPTKDVTSGPNASQARKHKEFDNDPETMNSVLLGILGKTDIEQIIPYQNKTEDRGVLNETRFLQFNWPDELLDWFFPNQIQTDNGTPTLYPPTISVPKNGSGRRRALCVGINRYQSSPLNGCVADAKLWATTLGNLGFEIQMLTDEQATFDGIIGSLKEMVQSSRPGDVLVFQYAGHGIELPDVNGDETGGDSPKDDEAICPYDYTAGRFVLDDDIAQVFNSLKSTHRGVNVTCFFDCCHSGTLSRFGVGIDLSQRGRGADERARSISVTSEMVENHRRFRRSRGMGRSLLSRGPDNMSEVIFSACLSGEKAYENNGQGDFTRYAVTALSRYGIEVTHQEFEQRVREAFGSSPRQHPNLDCAPVNRQTRLLQPLAVYA